MRLEEKGRERKRKADDRMFAAEMKKVEKMSQQEAPRASGLTDEQRRAVPVQDEIDDSMGAGTGLSDYLQGQTQGNDRVPAAVCGGATVEPLQPEQQKKRIASK